MGKFNFKNGIHWNEDGAMEGLPLYLIILVVITAIAIVIIITWLTIVQPADLDHVEFTTDPALDPDGDMKDGTSYNITFTAYGTKDGKLSGVSITLEGPGYSAKTLKTGEDGTVTFHNVTPSLDQDVFEGEMSIKAKYTGAIPQTKNYSIAVKK